ncbi:MAG: site-specific DNA-methyltransferase [Colwellia sp.]|nr:site-specific DNA-methyltransferase [Colwellia sp.]
MAKFSNDFFDIAILDPEWGINASTPSVKPNKVKQRNGAILNVKQFMYNKKWDSKPADYNYGNEAMRVSKNQIIFGANFFEWIVRETFKPPSREEYKKFMEKYPTGWIIWDKINGNCDQWDCELAWTSFDKPTVIYEYMWNGMQQGSRADGKKQEGNKKKNEKRILPTQKPIRVYEWILNEYAIKGNIIGDFNIGSQASRIAAYNMRFDFYGCENDIDHYQQGNKRFNNHIAQKTLF